jgi:hypothetical protein
MTPSHSERRLMSTCLSVQFEDNEGNRLEARMEHRSSGYLTCLIYRKRGKGHIPLQGVTCTFQEEKRARASLRSLEEEAKRAGWHYRVQVQNSREAPAPMEAAEDGARMFKDSRTGAYVRDDSSFRPLLGVRGLPRIPEDVPPKHLSAPHPKRMVADAFTEVFAPVQ